MKIPSAILFGALVLAGAPSAPADDQDPAAARAEAKGLLDTLKKDPSQKKVVAAALGKLGPQAGAAIETLAGLAASPDDEVRGNAVWALGKIAGPRYTPVALPRSAEDTAKYYPPTEDSRANEEPLAKLALPALKKAMVAKSADVRVNAAFALGCMEERAADSAPLLAKAMLNDKDQRVRRNAAWALSKVPGEVKAVLPSLRAAAVSDDGFVRHAACTAVAWYGPAGAAALPEVLKAMDKEKGGRLGRKVDYVGIIATMGEAAAAAVPKLVPLLDSAVDTEKASVAYCLGRIRVGVLPHLPRLVELLASQDMYVRWNAAWALGRLGPDAKAACPELRRIAEEDPDPAVKANAEQALSLISGLAVPTGSDVPEPTGSGSGGVMNVSSGDTIEVVK